MGWITEDDLIELVKEMQPVTVDDIASTKTVHGPTVEFFLDGMVADGELNKTEEGYVVADE